MRWPQHREPGEGVRRGGGGERDGEHGGVHGDGEWAADKDMGEAEPGVREGGGVRARRDAERPKPHHHRPELLPRRQRMPRPGELTIAIAIAIAITYLCICFIS